MKIDVYPKLHASSVDELGKKLHEALKVVNNTKSGKCWICNKVAHNWGILFPDSPAGLGMGSTDNDTRIAFFPYCVEHDINDEEIIEKVNAHWKSLKSEMLN